jgi:light-harvesting complex I chlorophyll a/b binding protein 1
MALPVALIAALLVLAKSQASDKADRSNAQDFLSKYVTFGSDDFDASAGHYDKFIIPTHNNVKYGDRSDALSYHKSSAEHGPAAVDTQLANGNSNTSITLSAIGVGLLALVTMLGARLRTGLQPVSDMSINMAPGLGDNFMEMQSQAHEMRRPVGWGQLSSQNANPHTLCYSAAPSQQPGSTERSAAMPFLPRPMKLEGMVGDKGFDPLGLSEWVPVDWLRESELKHGRVCMLAVVGFVATDLGFRLPGEMHQVASINAHDMAVDMGAMTQIITFIAIAECIGYLAILEMLDGSGRQPGNFGLDPLRIGGADDPEMQLKEIENGRLAMLAFAGIVTQAVLTGKGFPYF